ncbi:hypothetical protein CHS0354_025946 [Potamilus streckersoni]|uniref:CUB domain-containing protein n=1 Tax=Potamilus streckersoni TaxID=2493646 RepID=A0AAE0T4Y1_9BIVA|nr:hypothetical protein CHS0354_025946 [Potamilus streckersoni]
MWKVLLGVVWCVQFGQVYAIRDSACYGTTLPCDFYSMSCYNRSLIQVDRLQYGMQQGRCQSKNYTKCKVEEIGCCASKSSDCFEEFNQDHTKSVLDKCSGRSSCGPMQAVQTRLTQPHNCSSQFSNYVIVDYSCVSGTSLLNLGSNLTLTGPEVNIIFNSAAFDTIYRNHSTNYTCTIVQTGYQSVNLELVDIRLQKPRVAQSCSSVKISIPNANFSAECSEENKQQNVVYMRRSVMNLNNEEAARFSIDDMFSLNSGDYPVMIWIKFRANPPYTVSVTCRDQKFPDDSGGESQTTIEGAANNNTGVIIGVLIPVLFLIVIAVIVGIIVFRRRHKHIIEKKAVVEFQNKARYDELPMGKPKLEVTLSNSLYADIDESKIVNLVSATSRDYSHCSDQQEEYLVPSKIPDECAPGVDRNSSHSHSGVDGNLNDESRTKPKSDKSVSSISRVQYVNTVEDKSPKKKKASKIEEFMNTSAFGNEEISVESTTESGLKDVYAKKTTDKVLKVKRLADDYIEFGHGELYDKPQEPKLVDKNDLGNKEKNLLPSTSKASGKNSNKDNPVVFVYDYADQDGGNGFPQAGEHFMEDNMYEAVDDDHIGPRDDCDKANEVFTYDYADQGSTSLKLYSIDSISVGKNNVSFDKSHESIQPPKDASSCSEVPHHVSPPTSSSSLSPVSHPSSSLPSNISTSSSTYVNSPRVKSANKPITASKPNATDGYAQSPKLRAGKRQARSHELTVNGGDLKDKGNESHSNVKQAVLSVGDLKRVFEKQEKKIPLP